MRSRNLLCALLCALAACGDSSNSDPADAHFPPDLQPVPAAAPKCAQPAAAELFPPVDPTALGFDPQRLQEAVQFGTQLGSTSVRVYRYGCLAAESPADALAYAVPQVMASGTKTILALSVGRAVTLGYLGVDDPIGKYLPEADEEHGRITVRQLLNQTSGLKLVLADEVAGLLTDPVRYTLTLPFWYEPGTEFMYAHDTLSVLARVVERASGIEFQQFTQHELMAPLGIPRDHWVWLRDRSGGTIAMGGLGMRPDDEARIGHLMLYQGRWQGRQLIDAAYMGDAITGTKANPGYGFLIWLNEGDTHKGSRIGRPIAIDHELLPGTPRDAYGAMGAGGQMIVAVPSRHLVIVRNGAPTGGASTVEGQDYKELIRLVTASVNDLPQDTGPGPYEYDDPSQFDPGEFDEYLADLPALGLFLGIGATTMADCTVVWCNGRSPVDDLANLGLDAVQQALNAVAASAADIAAGRRYSEVQLQGSP